MKNNKYRLILLILAASIIFSCTSYGGEESADSAETEADTPFEAPDKKDKAGSDESLLRESEVESDYSAAPPMMLDEEEAGFGMKSAASPEAADYDYSNVPAASGLKAGFSDDNRQYGYFLGFLEEHRQNVVPVNVDVSERIILEITDSEGKSVPGVSVKASADKGGVTGLTLADGTYQINPSELFTPRARDQKNFIIELSGGESLPGFYRKLNAAREGERVMEITAQQPRVVADPVPLDVVFVMDTTGSMGEEISRLKNTIRIIHMNLTSLSVAADVRFGMVLYKDVGDDYRTRVIPLTGDINAFQASLEKVEAFGGGDTPEDLEAALDDLMNRMKWNKNGVRLAYVITDAPPHLDYKTNYSSADALRDARKDGIKIFTIGTGGLGLQGEYNLRQIAQYTSARYIFLTYGSETGESEGGAPGSVSHHTGSNWSADKLESIIIRFTREELSYLSDSPLIDEDPWFEAGSIDTEEAEDTLAELFSQTLDQLLDYSVVRITEKNLLAVLPFQFEEDSAAGTAADAEYFNEHLVLAAAAHERIKLAERKDIGQLLGEIEFQNLGITDDDSVSRIGEFLNADILITGNMFIKDGKYELFLKMLRVETAEVLSVTRAVIDTELGLQ